MFNFQRIFGLLSLSACLVLGTAGGVRSQEYTKVIGNRTVQLKSCGWKGDLIVCNLWFSVKSRHSEYDLRIPFSYVYPLHNSKHNIINDGYLSNNIVVDGNTGNGSSSFIVDPSQKHEITISTTQAASDTTNAVHIRMELVDETGNDIFEFKNISLGTLGSSSTRPVSPTRKVTRNNNSGTCPNGESLVTKAESRNFYLYICGDSQPTHYIGKAKDGGNSIVLPLSSYGNGKYVAKNGNVSYILTREFLIVTENGKAIVKERLQN